MLYTVQGFVDTALVNQRQKFTDKSDRATAEQVLDPRTRIILLRLINQNVITEIHGCISTGKEVVLAC